MFSRIMASPAGLMRKALGRGWPPAATKPCEPPVPPPDYWMHRYSRLGLILAAPPPPASGAAHPGPADASRIETARLSAQGGKASSFLAARP